MKGIDKSLIKGIGISFLIVIAIVLLVIVFGYNKISIGKTIPKIEPYELSEETKKELETEKIDENSEVIITYELNASDLKKYEKTKQYNKGKKNPFAAEAVETPSQDGNTTANEKDNSSSENFYKDEGIK